MKHINIILILTVFLLIYITATAQEKQLHFERITIENGLPINSVNCITQDKYGFIWLGTNNGLCRYDGNSIMVIKHNADDPYSISSNKIISVLIDTKNRFWVATDMGLDLFNPTLQKSKRYKLYYSDNNKKTRKVNSIYEDRSGRIWASTDCLNCIDPLTDSVTYYCSSDKPNSLNKYFSSKILQDVDGKYWIATWSDNYGIDTLNYKTGKFYNMQFKGRDKRIGNDLAPELVSCIFNDSKNNLWFGCFTGVYYLNRATKIFRNYYYHDEENNFNASVTSINEDIYGNIWIGTFGNGLFIYNIQTKKFQHFLNEAGKTNSLSDNRIKYIFRDNKGSMWVATQNGVSKADLFLNQFNILKYNKDGKENFNLAQNTIFEDKEGSVWTDLTVGIIVYGGRANGMVKYDFKTEKFSEPIFWGTDRIVCSVLQHNEDIYIVCPKAIYSIDKQGKQEMVISNAKIDYIEFDKKNPDSFWGFSDWLVYKTDIKTGLPVKFYPVLSEKSNEKLIIKGKNSKILSINDYVSDMLYDINFVDSKNRIWGAIRTKTVESRFLYKLNFNTEKFEIVHPDTFSNIISISENKAGDILLGTINGLYSLNPETNQYQYYSSLLPADSVLGAWEDKQNNLWVIYKYGLFRLDQTNNQIQTFYCNTDIPGVKEFSFIARQSFHLGQKSGQIYLSTIDGIFYFNPEQVKYNSESPSVFITDFHLFNRDCNLDSAIFAKKKITLKADQNYFTIAFSVLNYSNSKYNKYKYLLENMDENWITTTKPEADYKKVPHGKYVFRVKGCNNKGVWSENETILEIEILPPFYYTWWAYLSYIIIIVLIIYSIVKFNTYRLQKDKQKLEQIVEERTVELKEKNEALHMQKEEIYSQAEELRATNEKLVELDQFKEGMTGMIVHDLKNPLNTILFHAKQTEIVQAGNQMLNLVMNILDVQKFENAQINILPADICLNKCIGEALIQVQHLYLRKSITVENLLIKDIIIKGDFEIISRVFINLLTNAIKYTPNNGVIKLLFTENEKNTNLVQIGVQDSGLGIPAEKQKYIFDKFFQVEAKNSGGVRSTGLGLTFCKLAVEAHGGKIWVESEIGKGSAFWLRLPLSQSTVKPEYSQPQIIAAINPETVSLTTEDKEYLQHFIPDLRNFTVYEFSDIKKIAQNITNGNERIEKWKELLINAVKACNEEKYMDILNLEKEFVG